MNTTHISLTTDLVRKAELLRMAGDPIRIRILCLMFKRKKACVSDIAEAIGVPLNVVSHHLQKMKYAGYFQTERMGTAICYEIIESPLTKLLERFICS